MCYSVSTHPLITAVEQRFDAKFEVDGEYKSYYHANGFAKPKLPVIAQNDHRTIELFTWSSIPIAVKDWKTGKMKAANTLNVTDANVQDLKKSVHKKALIERRLLVLVNGFYENRHLADGTIIPYFIGLKDEEQFSLGGVYCTWQDEKTGTYVDHISIITTAANEMMALIHNKAKRMPLVIPRPLEKEWLNPDLPENEIKNFIVPFDSSQMRAHSVPQYVKNPKDFKDKEESQKHCFYEGVDNLIFA